MSKLSLQLVGSLGALALSSLMTAAPIWAETGSTESATVQKIDRDINYNYGEPSADLTPVGRIVELSEAANTVSQGVTSVSQLSDVKPTDWAFTAVQSLVERYGCIAGYPDRTYRGGRAMTRYEFAAGLNACLDKINEILASGLADKVSKEDLAAVQKLQEEFAAELAAIKGRVDVLETKTATLERQQFSTTTKLDGQTIIAITGGTSGRDNFFGPSVVAGNGQTGLPLIGVGKSNVTVNARVRLDFNTSFTGRDLLITRLEVGNGGGTTGNLLGVNAEGNLGNIGLGTYSLDYAGLPSNFVLGKLRYDFKVGNDLKLSVGPVMHIYDHVDVNSFANNEAVDFSSTFFINNPLVVLLNLQTGMGGGAFDWNPGGGAFSVRGVYLAANASAATRGNNGTGILTNRGLTGDPYQGTVEVEFAPKTATGNAGPFAIRLQYTNASISNMTYNTGGVNVEWSFSKNAALFGRYGFGTIDCRSELISNCNGLRNFVNRDATGNSLSPSTFMVGLAFPNLFREGALGAIAIGQPFIESKVGNSTQTNLELFYNLPITKNIRITPDLQFIFNPNNNSANGTVTVGTLRTVFSF